MNKLKTFFAVLLMIMMSISYAETTNVKIPIKPEVTRWINGSENAISQDKEEYQYTLSLIKPDAVKRGLVNKINQHFKDGGLKVIQNKRIKLSREQAADLYAEHKGKPFFDALLDFMTSGDVVVQILAGPNAVIKNRTIMGATDPKNALPGTIRNTYAESREHNCVHGSDSVQAAKREISIFFG